MTTHKAEHIAYNALALASRVNRGFISKARSLYGTYAETWQNAHGDRLAGCATKTTIDNFLAARDRIDPAAEWKRLEHAGISLMLTEDDEYPELLREIYDPPLGLYIQGQLRPIPAIAMIGTRKASAYGLDACRVLVRDLAPHAAIVSGLAYGIDTAAHAAAIEHGGVTWAVIGSGLDAIYPAKNAGLAKKISASGGAVISEYPLGTEPRQHHFPERNRIVSGLSAALVVIEYPEKSGSLITARLGLESGREVAIVPGSIFSKNFHGSHRLIREGAHLVSSAQDILQLCGIDGSAQTPHVSTQFESDEQAHIYECIRSSAEPQPIEHIIRTTGLAAAAVNQQLTLLMIKGIIKELNGGFTAH